MEIVKELYNTKGVHQLEAPFRKIIQVLVGFMTLSEMRFMNNHQENIGL